MSRRLAATLSTLWVLCLALSCSRDGTTDKKPIDYWLGAWQYMDYENRELVPDGDRKILFSSDSTWEHSHNSDNGIYFVFEDRFLIRHGDSGTAREGNWTLDGDSLKLDYDTGNTPILRRTLTFNEYVPKLKAQRNAGLPSDIAGYESWRAVELGAPPAEFEVPQDSGSAHGLGTRTVYINSTGVETLEDTSEQTFHSGTTIVKDIMDDANSFVWRVAVMWKVDDTMYGDHNGWKYVQYQRDSADAAFIGVAGDINAQRGVGCHACHSKVNDEAVPGKDSVFTQLP